jgi:hypothetical protein
LLAAAAMTIAGVGHPLLIALGLATGEDGLDQVAFRRP